MSMVIFPDNISWTIQTFVTKLGMVVYCHELEFHIFKVKITVRAFITKIRLFRLYLLNFLPICNQTKADYAASWAWMSCEILDCCVYFKVKIIAKVWYANKCLSRWYLPNYLIFSNHIWYDGVLSWVRVSCRIIDLLP